MKNLTDDHFKMFKKIRDQQKEMDEMEFTFGGPPFSATPAQSKFLIKLIEFLLPNAQYEQLTNPPKESQGFLMDLIDEVEKDEKD